MRRELGILSAAGISLAAVAPALAFINLGAGMASIDRVDYYVPLVAGGLIWAVALCAYRALVGALPRAGGEYVFLSRIVSPAVGSVAGIVVAVVFAYAIASNARFLAAYVPLLLTGLGSAIGSHAIAAAGPPATGTEFIALTSIVAVAVAAAGSLVPLRRLAQALAILSALQLLALGVVALLLVSHSHQDFVAAFGRYSHHPDAYRATLEAGTRAGVRLGGSAAAELAAIPLMLLNYNGVLYSDYLGGELRRPARTYTWASGIGLVVLMATWLGIWALCRQVVGLHFMQAQAQLAGHDPGTYARITTLPAAAGGLGYGLVLTGDTVTQLLLGTIVPVAAMAGNTALFGVTARVLFALASDRVLPFSLARLSDGHQVPARCLLVVTAGSVMFCALLAFLGIGAVAALESVCFAFILVAGGVAAALLPRRRPDLMRTAGTSGDSNRTQPLVARWAGAATAGLAAGCIADVVMHLSAYGGLGVWSLAALGAMLLAGPAIYGFACHQRRRRGQIDLRLALVALPPD